MSLPKLRWELGIERNLNKPLSLPHEEVPSERNTDIPSLDLMIKDKNTVVKSLTRRQIGNLKPPFPSLPMLPLQ